MQLSQQCISKELAVKLKEAGVEQVSLFRWEKFSLDQEHELFYDPAGEMVCLSGTKEDSLSAFSASEMAEMLKTEMEVGIDFTGDGFRVMYGAKEYWWHQNLAEALGEAVLFLKTNLLI